MPDKDSRDSSYSIPSLLLLLAVLATFLYLSVYFVVAQDDSFISYRYAQNFLNGKGLVFNEGERVEGYTNFLWVILNALLKTVTGFDFLLTSRALGVVSGSLIFVLLFFLTGHYSKEGKWLYFLASVMLPLANPALPYWSTSGMETATFALAILSALISEEKRPELTTWLLALATLLRPDGAVAFGAILLHRLYRERQIPWVLIMEYFILLLPFAIFKLVYYGSLLPNSYYAKSGFGPEYILSGMEYFWFFCSTVGLYGIVFALPLMALPILWKRFSLYYLFVAAYLLYIIWIGGDVLKVYRFFVPILAPMGLLFGVSLIALLKLIPQYNRMNQVMRSGGTILLVCGMAAYSFYGGLGHARSYQSLEMALVDKMEYAAVMLKRYMGSDFSIAASTIGKLGYSLPDHRVIDMLGLTDRQIARNPESIPGLISTWKERRFNSSYLLSQRPDFVFFSTEYKPSAPAEQALFLHSEFRKNYFPIGFPKGSVLRWISIYRKWNDIDISQDTVLAEAGFPQNLKAGFDYYNGGNFEDAILAFEQARNFLGEDYFMVNYGIGRSFFRLNLIDSSKYYFEKAIALNPFDWHSHYYLTRIAVDRNDTAAANEHAIMIARLAPWLMDEARRHGIALPEDIEGD